MSYTSCKGMWRHIIKTKEGEITKLFFRMRKKSLVVIYEDGVAVRYSTSSKPIHRNVVSLRRVLIPEVVLQSIEIIFNKHDKYSYHGKVPWELRAIFTAFYDRMRFEKLKRVKNEFITR